MDFGRLIVAMATPFGPDLEVDLEGARRLALRLVDQGVQGLVVSGTTGESSTLSQRERVELLRAVKAAVRVPVISNAGTNDTRTSLQNARDAEEAGADGILLVVPYYNKPDQGMLYEHFKDVAESVRIPCVIYNVPGRTATSVAPDTVVRLSRDVSNIVAIKEASGDLDAITHIVNEAAPGFVAYTGEDRLALPSLAVGAYGVVSVAGHIVAPMMREMIESYLAGRTARAALLHGRLRQLDRALFLQPNPVPLKAAMKLIGFDIGGLRPPLREASAEVEEALRAALVGLGLLE